MKTKLSSEFFGSAFLVMVVLGSGLMGERLFPGQVGAALLANSLATGAGLFVLIQSLAPLSGAHLNPIVSLVELLHSRLGKKEFIAYVIAQMSGAYLGVILTHVMFQHPVFELSTIERAGAHLLVSEVVATFGLIAVIALSGKAVAPSVACYIMAAYWFTSSTSFANPAVTFARVFTNTFGGMDGKHFIYFVLAQILGAVLAWKLLLQLKQKRDP